MRALLQAPWSRRLVAVSLLAAVAACAHGAVGTPMATRPRERRPAAALSPSGPPQYLVADPSVRSSVPALALGGGGALGLVVDKTRIVIGRGEPRVGAELPDQPIGGVRPIPSRLGGGFLFWTDSVVYRADSFDGTLIPLARMPDGIQNMSFAPKYLLVRTRNGERWALAVPSGERVPIVPLGAADVEALDDGRAVAFDDQGAVFTSLDHGAHWLDVTSQVKSSPARVAVVDDEVWLFESSGGGLRLEPDGHLSTFDKQPPEKPPAMRARDPRWRGAEAPLRMVFHGGASIDESTAVVIEQGDVVRVDVHTGAIVGVVAGKLPPDSRCEAVPTASDVLFACVSRGAAQSGSGQPSAFVVSRTLTSDAPTVEQTFQTTGQFYGGDDGGLAIGVPCGGGSSNNPDHAVCVRQPDGRWQDFDLSSLASDAGHSDVNVARWVPRADGGVVAIILDPAPGIFDPRTGQLDTIDQADREVLAQGLAPAHARYRRHMGGRVLGGLAYDGASLVDWGWSFSSTGTLRGWQRHGGIVEVTNDGRVTRSPYAFDLVTAGAYALGRTQDGRLYQSTDHGASFVEVAGPPSGAAASDLRSCSSAGCDLGGFYRVGWAARAPRVEPPLGPAKLAPDVRRTRPVELACRPAGAAQAKVLSRTNASPEDLGLGNVRLAVAGDRSEIQFVRNVVPRGIVHPLHEPPGGDSEMPSLRGILSGFGTTRDGDVLEVTGPNKNATALRRTFTFIPPFDPAAPVKKIAVAMSDVIAAGLVAGMTHDEILEGDMTESGDAVVMTPGDATAPGDLVFHNERGLLVRIRPGSERVKMAMRPSQNEGRIVSGITLANDDAAFLELDTTGVGHVYKMSGGGGGALGGLTDLFDVNPTAVDGAFYPANPDTLAVGPRGDLAVLRTGSGSDPASAHDPALLLIPATPPAVLAPWSTLRLADDPSCKEPGWRATLQVIAPWVRVTTPELRAEDAPMIARVKWSDKRVCLEALELKVADVSVRAPGVSGSEVLKVGSWLVARGNTFARVAIADGVEWRQPLECSLTAPPSR
jgi:hypothetical protein